MKYLKTIFIASVLLNVYGLRTEEPVLYPLNTDDTQNFPMSDFLMPVESNDLFKSIEETKVAEKNELQSWNDHLELLTIEGEYWDAANNIPSDSWKSRAFEFAENALIKDKNLASTLKSQFLDAIQSKLTLEKVKMTKESTEAFLALIKEFDDMIDNLVKQQAPVVIQETLPAMPTTFTVPEITTPEPIIELAPPSSAENSTTTTNTDSSSSTSASTPEATPIDLNSEWQKQLEEIKRSGENWLQIDALLTKTYDIAKQIIISEPNKQQQLQSDMYDALETRKITGKKLYPLDIKQTMAFFNNSIGVFAPEEQSSSYKPYLPTAQQQEQYIPSQEESLAMQQLKEELAAKDALAKEELEKQKRKEMETKAALIELEKQGKLTREQLQAQLHQATQLQKDLEAKVTKKHAEELEEIKQAHAALLENERKMAAAQKPTQDKGIIANITENISNWWYGTSDQKPNTLSTKDEEALLNNIVQNAINKDAAKKTFKKFQSMLLNFNTEKFWDAQQGSPNFDWIRAMQPIIKSIVIDHHIMPLDEMLNIVRNILVSGKVTPGNIERTVTEIAKPAKEEEIEQAREKAAVQQNIQRRKDKNEEIMRAQQKVRDEQDRIEREKQQSAAAAISYKDEKKQWYALLEQVAQNKQATSEINSAHTQEALKKSQTLLNLASNIPAKNKAAISQKLKQKFSVALLDQQKNNEGPVNIYQTMDVFNKEVNNMMD